MYLNINPAQWNRASQKVSEAMQDITIISKVEYDMLAKERIDGINAALSEYPEAITSDQREEKEWLEAHQTLSQDIKWFKPPKGIKRNGQPLNGLIDWILLDLKFTGQQYVHDSELNISDYEILKRFIAESMSEKRLVIPKRPSLF